MVNRLATAQSTVAIWHWRPAAIVTLATVAALTALTADAPATQARPAPPAEATAPRAAGEPIMAIVSIKTQQVTLYDADGWILRAPVSTGVTGRETPAGVFAVLEKEKDLCVPKTLSALISRRNHLTSVDHVRTVLFRPGRFGLAVQVEEPT